MPALRQNRTRTQRAVDDDARTDRIARLRYRRSLNIGIRHTRNQTPWWVRINAVQNLSWRSFWSRTCNHCGTDLLDTEPDSFCCRGNSLVLPSLPPYPAYWNEAMLPHDVRLGSFIRKLNGLFSFTAIGVSSEGFTPAYGAVAITGRVYHRILDPGDGAHSWRWFLYDSTGRTTAADQLRVPQQVIEATCRMLEEFNPFLNKVRSAMASTDASSYAVFLDQPSTGGEIAAIVSAQNLSNIQGRRIVVTRTDSRPVSEFIDIMSPSYEPLQYPLLFPFGSVGWSRRNAFGFTQIEWYRARLLQDPIFSRMGPLVCEWAVDMYSRVEEDRLAYLKRGRQEQARHQRTFPTQNRPSPRRRDGDVRDLGDPAFESGAQEDEFTLESSIPASFLGSRQWASRQVADCLALARVYRQPSLFITVTTNPRWPEIQQRLRPGQHPLDLPHVLARVFQARLRNMTDLSSQTLPILYTSFMLLNSRSADFRTLIFC